MVRGNTYRCSSWGLNQVLKVDTINDTKKTVDGVDADGSTRRTNYDAKNCRPFNPALGSLIAKDGKAVRLGQRYVCKGVKGFGEFVVKGRR